MQKQPQKVDNKKPLDEFNISSLCSGQVLLDKYKLDEKIGFGSFGLVWRAIKTDTNDQLAIKFEKRSMRQSSMLVREIKVMNEMKHYSGFPRLITYGKSEEYNYIVMTLLGRNLDSLMKKCGHRFSLATIANVGYQMVRLLEKLHYKNLLHRDIKPENFVIGTGPQFTRLYLIDFGLAKYYQDNQQKHIPMVDKKGMIGTARYASIQAHQGCEQGRRDDLEAVGYVLVYLAKGRLPWQSIQAENKEMKYEKIKQMKLATSIEQICEGAPIELIAFFKHVRALDFQDEPDYAFLKRLFQKMANKKDINPKNIPLDWENIREYKAFKRETDYDQSESSNTFSSPAQLEQSEHQVLAVPHAKVKENENLVQQNKNQQLLKDGENNHNKVSTRNEFTKMVPGSAYFLDEKLPRQESQEKVQLEISNVAVQISEIVVHNSLNNSLSHLPSVLIPSRQTQVANKKREQTLVSQQLQPGNLLSIPPTCSSNNLALGPQSSLNNSFNTSKFNNYLSTDEDQTDLQVGAVKSKPNNNALHLKNITNFTGVSQFADCVPFKTMPVEECIVVEQTEEQLGLEDYQENVVGTEYPSMLSVNRQRINVLQVKISYKN